MLRQTYRRRLCQMKVVVVQSCIPSRDAGASMALTDSITRLNQLIQGIPSWQSSLPSVPILRCTVAPWLAQPVDARRCLLVSHQRQHRKSRSRQDRTARQSLLSRIMPRNRYVSVSGFCELIRDRDKRKGVVESGLQILVARRTGRSQADSDEDRRAGS